MGERRVLLGVITAPHGLKGEVKVKTFTETPEGLAAYGPLVTADGRRVEITGMRRARGSDVLVRFSGVEDRAAAERLAGQPLYVLRAALPEPKSGEFYHADLIGLKAEDPAGRPLGTVSAVHNFGAGDVLEIALAGGETEFIAFTDDNVPEVDVAGGRIVIVPPRYVE